MRLKKSPCCGSSMNADDILHMIEDSGDNDVGGVFSKNVTCPNCGKSLLVYLNVDSVEVDE